MNQNFEVYFAELLTRLQNPTQNIAMNKEFNAVLKNGLTIIHAKTMVLNISQRLLTVSIFHDLIIIWTNSDFRQSSIRRFICITLSTIFWKKRRICFCHLFKVRLSLFWAKISEKYSNQENLNQSENFSFYWFLLKNFVDRFWLFYCDLFTKLRSI